MHAATFGLGIAVTLKLVAWLEHGVQTSTIRMLQCDALPPDWVTCCQQIV